VKFTNHSEEAAGMTHYRGVTYFKTFQEAREIRDSIRGESSERYPEIIRYGRGFAVQLRRSGPYYFAG
jgi:hypothetical protein